MKNGENWRVHTLQTTKQRLKQTIKELGADPYATNIWEKGMGLAFKIYDMPCAAANILKQEALASGIDVAVARGTVNCSIPSTDVAIIGNLRGFKYLIERLKRQPYKLADLAIDIERLTSDKGTATLLIKGKTLPLDTAHVMGIVNVTPDSFSDGGQYLAEVDFQARIQQVIDEGAMFIDIGGISTRPGFSAVPCDEEMRRVLPAVEIAVYLAKKHDVFVSLDSWNYDVLKKCLEIGIDLINDQSGLADERIISLIQQYNVAYCLMYNNDDSKDDILTRTWRFLSERVQKMLAAGIDRRNIILDPGFGFLKNVDENYRVLRHLSELCDLGYPLLAGVSRKSMINAAVDKPAQKRTSGTLAAEVLAANNGARIIRTHNVQASVDAMKVFNMSIDRTIDIDKFN